MLNLPACYTDHAGRQEGGLAGSMKKGAAMFRKAADAGSVAAAGIRTKWRKEKASVIKASKEC